MAVSYTHLDVYKRQPIRGRRFDHHSQLLADKSRHGGHSILVTLQMMMSYLQLFKGFLQRAMLRHNLPRGLRPSIHHNAETSLLGIAPPVAQYVRTDTTLT